MQVEETPGISGQGGVFLISIAVNENGAAFLQQTVLPVPAHFAGAPIRGDQQIVAEFVPFCIVGIPVDEPAGFRAVKGK